MTIVEAIYEYEGLWTPGGSCGLQIFHDEISVPTVVISELPWNRNTSVTNLIGCIAAEVLTLYLPAQIGETPPFHCVEHYPRERGSNLRETFDLVSFELNVPTRRWHGAKSRITLGTATWKPFERRSLERMIRCAYPDTLGILERTTPQGATLAALSQSKVDCGF
jgi:hypothetical protein